MTAIYVGKLESIFTLGSCESSHVQHRRPHSPETFSRFGLRVLGFRIADATIGLRQHSNLCRRPRQKFLCRRHGRFEGKFSPKLKYGVFTLNNKIVSHATGGSFLNSFLRLQENLQPTGKVCA
jgi:hypothetical protein